MAGASTGEGVQERARDLDSSSQQAHQAGKFPTESASSCLHRQAVEDEDASMLGSLRVIVIDSRVQHQRRTPWSGWGEFPLLPVGDPAEYSETYSTVAGHFFCGDFDNTVRVTETEEDECGRADHLIKPFTPAVPDLGCDVKSSTTEQDSHSREHSPAPSPDDVPALIVASTSPVPSDKPSASASVLQVQLRSVFWWIVRLFNIGLAGSVSLLGFTLPQFLRPAGGIHAVLAIESSDAAAEPAQANTSQTEDIATSSEVGSDGPPESPPPAVDTEAAPCNHSTAAAGVGEAAEASVAAEASAAASVATARCPPASLAEPQMAQPVNVLHSSAFERSTSCPSSLRTESANGEPWDLANSHLASFFNPPSAPGSPPDRAMASIPEVTPMQTWVDAAHTMLMRVMTQEADGERRTERLSARLAKAEPSSAEEVRSALELLQSKADGEWVVDAEEDGGDTHEPASQGWYYSTAFPTLAAQFASEATVGHREDDPYAIVRWRRWVRKRTLSVAARCVEELRWTGGHPETVTDLHGEVPAGSLAVMNLSMHRIVGCVYVPAGENVWTIRGGEVKGLGLGATWMVPELNGGGAVLAFARRGESLPVVMTAGWLKRVCHVRPEALFKRLFVTVAESEAMKSLVSSAGADDVMAMDTIQKDILLSSSHQDIQRLQFQAEHPEQRWREEAEASDDGRLCEEEQQAAAVRRGKVREALERLLGEPVAPEHVPTVALCLSGGGVRAMISALGALLAAEDMGVLDCCTYSSGLSGGAWLQGCWMETEGSNREVLQRLAEHLAAACSQHPLLVAGKSIAAEGPAQASRAGSRRDSWGSARSDGSGGDGAGEAEERVEAVRQQMLAWTSFAFGEGEGAETQGAEEGRGGGGEDGGERMAASMTSSWRQLWNAPAVEPKDSLASTLTDWYKWRSTPSVVELYGFTVANAFLLPRSDDTPRLARGLSLQAASIADGSRPLPLYTAVRLEDETAADDAEEYDWVEFSPFAFASCLSGRAVPVWALGRSFCQGRSVSSAPELPLPVLFGVWGAAFTASPVEVLRSLHLKRSKEPAAALAAHIVKLAEHLVTLGGEEASASRLKRMRVVHPFECPSPFADMQCSPPRDGSAPPGSPCGATGRGRGNGARGGQSSKLMLTDAGVNFNVPVPPLLRRERAVDVILMVDSRAFASDESVDESRELSCAAAYARQHRLAFPSLPASKLKGMGARPCTVFGGDDDGGAGTAAMMAEDRERKQAGADGVRAPLAGTHDTREAARSPPDHREDAAAPAAAAASPMVVYLPLVKNEGVDAELDPLKDDWSSFFEFQYEPDNFRRLLRLARENVASSRPQLVGALRRAVQMKRAAPSSSAAP